MAKKGKPQLRDLGRKKSKRQISERVQKASKAGNQRFYKELKLKEKAANERMRQLEKRDIKSPAYQSIQAQLEILGRTTKGNRGRRFSETGKATYNEVQLLNKILDEFLSMETSTVKGAVKYQNDVWESANKNNKLAEAGISRADWLSFWESMPDRKDRLYGSSFNVAIVRAYQIKQDKVDALRSKDRKLLTNEEKELVDMDRMTLAEVAEEISASKNLKDAYRRLGLSYKEVNAAKIKTKRARA